MSNFSKVSVADDARTELHDQLGLTGAEISINNLPAGAGVPFVHSHKQNEEIYVVLSGKGKAVIDGETVLGGRRFCNQLCMYPGERKFTGGIHHDRCGSRAVRKIS